MIDLLSISLILLVLLIGVSIIKGAPYLPSHRTTIEKMIIAACIKPGDKMVDLGAGDGRVVIAFAKAGAQAHGYEISPILVLVGKIQIWRAGLSGKAFIHWGNFWSKDFSSYSIVTVFGIPSVMEKLEPKLQKELKPGSKIISNIFQFPSWDGREDSPVYIYTKK